MLFEEAPRPAEFLERVHQHEAEIVTATRELLAGHPEVRVADLDTAARLVVATVESLVHRLVAGPVPVDPGRFEDELVDMLTRYLCAAPTLRNAVRAPAAPDRAG